MGISRIKEKSLADDAVSADKIAAGAVPSIFPFYKRDYTRDNISITNGEFPFYKADGSQDNIGVT